VFPVCSLAVASDEAADSCDPSSYLDDFKIHPDTGLADRIELTGGDAWTVTGCSSTTLRSLTSRPNFGSGDLGAATPVPTT
jgi:hypothetical protein